MAKGMIFKRCTCRAPVRDEHGKPVRDDHGRPMLRRLGATCPELKRADGTWNPVGADYSFMPVRRPVDIRV